MATAAISAQGVVLKRATVAIPEVTDISGPDESLDQIETTSLDSSAREYIAGLRDGGEVKIEANDIPSSTAQQAVYTDFTGGTSSSWVIDCVGSEQYAFTAFVKNFSRKFPTNGKRTISFTLKITGAVTPTTP